MARKKIIIRLNGTDKNPYHKLGFRMNPFPQIAKHELMPAMMAINKLGADPIPDTDYIRKVLKGLVSEELIDMCCAWFKKGEMTEFTVSWDE